jgi:dTDP-4-amino-4,6-dideoxygalactose transaminase/predicted O-linked N-acetylglucosamine transferase (SPINDLY family)
MATIPPPVDTSLMPDTTSLPLNEEIQRVAAEAMRVVQQHIDSGQFDQAAMVCRAILEMQPAHAQANHQLGLLEWQAHNLSAAAAHLSAALQADPKDASCWIAYVEVLLEGTELEAARRIIGLAKRHGVKGAALDKLSQRLARAERGVPSQKEIDAIALLLAQGRLDDAELEARVLMHDCPRHAYGFKALGVVFHRRGLIEPALEAMTMAAELDPLNAETLSNLGLLLKHVRRLDEAESRLRRSLELNPKNTDAHNNLGIVLIDLVRMADAEASARAALVHDAKNPRAWNTLGVALQHQNRLAEAIDAYRRVLQLEPENFGVYSNMLFAMSQMEGVDAATLFAEHRRFGERVENWLNALPAAHANSRDPARPLRVGFLSGDLRNHAVASFIEPVLERLAGRPGLTLHAYHNHVAFDHVSQRLHGYMNQWRDVIGLDDAALDACIRQDGIDILIDLSGHTAHNRLAVLARKPAPVQASWIGYPGTTGLRAVDYYLTDRVILPPGQFDHQFTEKLAHLPVSAPFQPEMKAPDVGPLPALAKGHVTFGSFNRISKIGRPVVAAWGRLLRALPDSKLLIAGVSGKDGAGQLLAWLAEEGVDAARVTLHPRCGLTEYLGLHNQVDISLDTFPYSGGTTTLHALWMGVPTLTMAGDTAAGRQTVCILEHSGLPQYIAHDADDFERKGVALSRDLDALAELRASLRDRFALPSSDFLTQVADGVEQALRTMWQRWCDGQAAASFEVPMPGLTAAGASAAPEAAPAPAPATIYVTQPDLPPLQDFVASLEQIWDSKHLTNGGPFHQQLEQALCEHLGVEHISLFANGTLALMTALQALGIEGEVITTPYSFAATTHAMKWNGLTPVFADIDPRTFNLDPDRIEAAITPSTRAIMPVHCYGTPCDVERIEAIARKHGLKVIYDAAHAFGVRQDGRSILRRGDLSVLSFHATKVFSTFEGGAIVCRDAATKRHIDHLKNFGIADEVTVVAAGINGKMNEVSAAMGLLQLQRVDAAIAKRGQVAAQYRRLLDGVAGITCMPEPRHDANHGYFPILVGDGHALDRDGLYQKLRDAGIHARRYFHPLISEFPMYRTLPSAAPGNLPHAAAAARQVLCLPIYPALAAQDIERIAGLIKST